MLRPLLLCLLSCWILVLHALPQAMERVDVSAEAYVFRSLPQTPQLYGTSVNAMLEDHEGYLWLATSSGLYRYDGYTLRNQHSVMPDVIPADEMVLNLQEDGNHHLWVSLAASSTYLVLDKRRAQVETRDYLRSLGMDSDEQIVLNVDRQGDIWTVAQDSIKHYRCATHQLRRHASPGFTLNGNQRLTVCSNGDRLYVIDGSVLRTYDEAADSWTEEVLPFTNPHIDNNVDGVKQAWDYVDSHGGLWIYSLFSEDIYYRSQDSQDWKEILLHNAGDEQNFIRGIAETPDDGVWIATNHRGLFLVNPEKDQVINFKYHMNDTHGLLSNNVNSLHVDRHGTLWLGYYKSGFSYCRTAGDDGAFTLHDFGDINAIAVTGGGMRWYGTDGRGLWRERDGQVTHVDAFPNVVITDLQCSPDGSIWIGTYNQGIFHLESGLKIRHYTAANGELPHDGAQRITIDGYGHLWVCSSFCPFYSLDPRTGQWTIHRDENGEDLMGNDVCYDALENIVVMATYWGLWIHNLNTDQGARVLGAQHGQLPLHEYQEHVLMSDPAHHQLWMAHSRGITVWDGTQDTLYLIAGDEGLTDPVISLCDDPQHNVWVNSASGLMVIQPRQTSDGRWRFKVRHILKSSSEISAPFNTKASAATPDGRMLFGMLDGYYDIDSRSILKQTEETVQPRFSTILVGDSVVFASRDRKDRLQLQLEYNTLPITFGFYTGNPLNASYVRYQYRICGLQETWVETSANTISLLTLPPGSYEFELKAIGPNAEWSDVETLYIEVHQPWWNSTWLRLLTSFLLLALGIFYVVWRLKLDDELEEKAAA